MNEQAMVMAIGESGQYEPTPADEVVEIEAVPLGAGNIVIPATVRWQCRSCSGGVPTRLRRVAKPKAGGPPWVYVEFDCTPFERFTLDTGPVMGDWSGCYVRNLADAADPILAGLSPRERARIRSAVVAAAAKLGGAA